MQITNLRSYLKIFQDKTIFTYFCVINFFHVLQTVVYGADQQVSQNFKKLYAECARKLRVPSEYKNSEHLKENNIKIKWLFLVCDNNSFSDLDMK